MDAVIPSNTFNCAPVAVIEVVPRTIDGVLTSVVASKLPVTLASPFDKVINPVSLVCPILEPLITTSSISSEPPLIWPVVVMGPFISILVNPLTIEPAARSPTVTISELPSFSPYIEAAPVVLNFAFNCVCIFDVALSSILILSAPTVTDTLSNLSVLAFTSPLVPYITALLLLMLPAEAPFTRFSSFAPEVTPASLLI